jgi:20S proteasome alpha/beta subunit
MTAICGFADKTGVYLGGDNLGVAGLSITLRSDHKVFHVGQSFIIGFTSSYRMGGILKYKFDPPQQLTSQLDDLQYMSTSFIDSVRACFSANGFGDGNNNTGGSFLVGYKGVLYSVDSDFQVGIPSACYDSVGCGSDLVLGAMFATEKMNMAPEKRITLALSAAEKFSGGVGGPFTIVSLKNESKTKVKN